MIYTGIILFPDETKNEKTNIVRGLYKVLLIEPKGTKIVHGIPLSVFGTHSGNFIRYSTVIYRPGDRVYLLQLNDESSKYYIILGSQGNIYIPDYNINRISIYDSITSQGLIINEPELTALNFAASLYIKNDTMHNIMSEIYLTTNPRLQTTELKHIDLLKGNIGAISLYSNIEDSKVLDALKKYYLIEEDEGVSFELKTPKNLVKTHIINSSINTRSESRILNFPYSFYRTGENLQISDNDQHILHSYNIPYYNTTVKFITDKSYLSENINLYFDENDTADKLFVTKDKYIISRKYQTARKVIYQKSFKNTKDSVNIIENYRKINYNAWLHLNEPYIQDSKIKNFKKDSYFEKRLIRLDTLNEAKEITESYFINQSSKNEYIRNISDIEIINTNKKTKIKDSTSLVQNSKYIVLKYDKYKYASFKKITLNNILQKVINEENNNQTIIDQKDNVIVINVANSNMQTIIEIKPDKINISVNNNTTINITKDNITVNTTIVTVNANELIVNGKISASELSISGGISGSNINVSGNITSASINTGSINCTSCSCCPRH